MDTLLSQNFISIESVLSKFLINPFFLLNGFLRLTHSISLIIRQRAIIVELYAILKYLEHISTTSKFVHFCHYLSFFFYINLT